MYKTKYDLFILVLNVVLMQHFDVSPFAELKYLEDIYIWESLREKGPSVL